MPPKFMTVSEACAQILAIIENKSPAQLTKDSLCIGLARVGSDQQNIEAATIKEMREIDLGGPLHSLVIPGPDPHPLELDFVQQFLQS